MADCSGPLVTLERPVARRHRTFVAGECRPARDPHRPYNSLESRHREEIAREDNQSMGMSAEKPQNHVGNARWLLEGGQMARSRNHEKRRVLQQAMNPVGQRWRE
jgi:hypothetical protein